MQIEIEHVSISEILPYSGNAKEHSDSQVAEIAASIREFGFSNPILIREDGTIIAGHGRYQAAQVLELHTVPVVRLSHLSETQARLLTLADNKIAEKGSWDEEMLKAELDDLVDNNNWTDVMKSGFSERELENLFDELEDIESDPVDTGNAPDMFRFRNYAVEMTKGEASALVEALEDYANEKGTYMGFVNYTLKGLK